MAHDYKYSLGRTDNEPVHAYRRSATLYVLTGEPPTVIGYAPLDYAPATNRAQKTIDDYLDEPKLKPNRK